MPSLQAVCAVKAGMDTRERNVAFFIALYLIPSATIAYFYSKTHNELRRQIAGEQINQSPFHFSFFEYLLFNYEVDTFACHHSKNSPHS